MRNARSVLARLALALASVAPLAACGGSSGNGGGGGGGAVDFPAFFTQVYQTTVVGTDPVSLQNMPTTNQLTDDETTFSHLVQ